jgi:hypothetical protein
MKEGARFSAPGSPLHGKKIPRDWHFMDARGKALALVSYGYAENFERACRVLGLHAAAVVRRRRERMEHAAARRHPEGKD